MAEIPETPQFNIKVGSDSTLLYSREYTEVVKNGVKNTDFGKMKENDTNGIDEFNYPVLARRTNHSIKGTTETIESNELRKGRTKSAPRNGTSKSEGNIEFEFSPETYDDFLEACFRNNWKEWKNDTNSASNIVEVGEDKPTCNDNEFLTQIGDPLYEGLTNGGVPIKNPKAKLLGDIATGNIPDKDGLIKVSNADSFEVAELTPSTEDIKYNILAQYGGLKNKDLYQDFDHLAVGSVELDATPGEIVTGSFGFLGSNNPDLLQKDAEAGVIKNKLLKNNGVTNDTDKITNAEKWLEALPEKGTSTDQATANESDVFVCGRYVQYSNNLTFTLDNGLKQIFAIGEKDSISTIPLSLDIKGDFKVYLIADHAELLNNLRTQDKDVEMLFTIKDKKVDPEYAYVFQIFKTKFTSNDISTGKEELDLSLPYSSFGERACRIFRIRKRKVSKIAFGYEDGSATDDEDKTVPNSITISLTSVLSNIIDATTSKVDPTKLQVKVTVDGDDTVATVGDLVQNGNVFTADISGIKRNATGGKDKIVTATVTYNGKEYNKSSIVAPVSV